MGTMEGLHGDWQYMSGKEVERALEAAGEAKEAAERGTGTGEDIALAAGGEGAAELEATAPVTTFESPDTDTLPGNPDAQSPDQTSAY